MTNNITRLYAAPLISASSHEVAAYINAHGIYTLIIFRVFSNIAIITIIMRTAVPQP